MTRGARLSCTRTYAGGVRGLRVAATTMKPVVKITVKPEGHYHGMSRSS